MQNQTISDLYTDDNKSKNSCNPKDIVKSEKKKNPEKHYIKQNSTAATTEFIGTKLLTERKCRMNTLIFVRRKYLRMKS